MQEDSSGEKLCVTRFSWDGVLCAYYVCIILVKREDVGHRHSWCFIVEPDAPFNIGAGCLENTMSHTVTGKYHQEKNQLQGAIINRGFDDLLV
jgi:hypothetical protein